MNIGKLTMAAAIMASLSINAWAQQPKDYDVEGVVDPPPYSDGESAQASERRADHWEMRPILGRFSLIWTPSSSDSEPSSYTVTCSVGSNTLSDTTTVIDLSTDDSEYDITASFILGQAYSTSDEDGDVIRFVPQSDGEGFKVFCTAGGIQASGTISQAQVEAFDDRDPSRAKKLGPIGLVGPKVRVVKVPQDEAKDGPEYSREAWHDDAYRP